MALSASPNPIVVDKTVSVQGSTLISYSKDKDDELSYTINSSAPVLISNKDLFVLVETAEAETSGSFPFTLAPGQILTLQINLANSNPIVRERTSLKVHCIWKAPAKTTLFADLVEETGGTWHGRKIVTTKPTSIIEIGVSEKPPVLDADGIPHLVHKVGVLVTDPLDNVNVNEVEINPLLPGHDYFFFVLVTDLNGNWDAVGTTPVLPLTTKLRTLSVQFDHITVFDDGDDSAHGECEFWFDIYDSKQVSLKQEETLLASFHEPTMDIDDWSNTGRPYSLTFPPFNIPLRKFDATDFIKIGSHANEDDTIGENDKAATFGGPQAIDFPVGRFAESVIGLQRDVSCQPTNGSLMYNATFILNVSYV